MSKPAAIAAFLVDHQAKLLIGERAAESTSWLSESAQASSRSRFIEPDASQSVPSAIVTPRRLVDRDRRGVAVEGDVRCAATR